MYHEPELITIKISAEDAVLTSYNEDVPDHNCDDMHEELE